MSLKPGEGDREVGLLSEDVWKPGADQREAGETDKPPVVFLLRKVLVLVLILVLHT